MQEFYLMAATIRTRRWNTAAARTARLSDQSNCLHLHHSTSTSLPMSAKRYGQQNIQWWPNCIVIGIGKMYRKEIAPMNLCSNNVEWCESIKYLGVYLQSGKYVTFNINSTK